MDLQLTIQNPNNPRNIPQTIFIENVEELVQKYTAEKILQGFQEIYNKYKLMEMQIAKQKENMTNKIPEIEKALEVVQFMSSEHDDDILMDFLLTDTMWAKAKIDKNQKKVALWLGANVMVEYTLEEAVELLKKNLANASANLKSYEEDINFLKDQITTCEVNISRVYNQNVKMVQSQAQKTQQ